MPNDYTNKYKKPTLRTTSDANMQTHKIYVDTHQPTNNTSYFAQPLFMESEVTQTIAIQKHKSVQWQINVNAQKIILSPAKTSAAQILHNAINALEQYIAAPIKPALHTLPILLYKLIKDEAERLQVPYLGPKELEELLKKIKVAWTLCIYKPANMPLADFINSEDIPYITGPFSTFDERLSRLMKSQRFSDVRDTFTQSINRYIDSAWDLAYEWQARIQQYPKLIQAAQQATPENEGSVYLDLFSTLTLDFSYAYGLYRFSNNNTLKPGVVCGVCTEEQLPNGKGVALHHDTDKHSIIIICLQRLKEEAEKHNVSLFVEAIAALAHELTHALDRQAPNRSPLGAQVNDADKKTKLPPDSSGHFKSASELHAYAVGDNVRRLLKDKYPRNQKTK